MKKKIWREDKIEGLPVWGATHPGGVIEEKSYSIIGELVTKPKRVGVVNPLKIEIKSLNQIIVLSSKILYFV